MRSADALRPSGIGTRTTIRAGQTPPITPSWLAAGCSVPTTLLARPWLYSVRLLLQRSRQPGALGLPLFCGHRPMLSSWFSVRTPSDTETRGPLCSIGHRSKIGSPWVVEVLGLHVSASRQISFSFVCALGTALVASEAASAERTQPTTSEAAIEEIVVTATKKERSERVQEVPFAVTAFGSRQLDALNFQNLASLSFTMPNVQLESNGTTYGVANFSI